MKLPQAMSLAQIAQMIGGKVAGDGDLKVDTVSTSPLHATEDDLAFVFDAKLVKKLAECKAKAVVAPLGAELDFPDRNMVLVDRPNLAIQRILTALKPKRYYPAKGIHATAVVDESAEIGADVAIGPYVVIGPKSKIGARTIIMSHTVIGGEVVIGEDCLLHPACLIADYVKIGPALSCSKVLLLVLMVLAMLLSVHPTSKRTWLAPKILVMLLIHSSKSLRLVMWCLKTMLRLAPMPLSIEPQWVPL
ncbi:MAG: hypothetical protein IPJ49_07240 [Candidatus Obscuribacter sp.]|nr:hypothetical protein [Candidatus Obscuribacter sp.]